MDVTKQKFVEALKGKTYGGRFTEFNPLTGTGKDLILEEGGEWIFHIVHVVFPEKAIEYVDEKFLITTESYYDIGEK